MADKTLVCLDMPIDLSSNSNEENERNAQLMPDGFGRAGGTADMHCPYDIAALFVVVLNSWVSATSKYSYRFLNRKTL